MTSQQVWQILAAHLAAGYVMVAECKSFHVIIYALAMLITACTACVVVHAVMSLPQLVACAAVHKVLHLPQSLCTCDTASCGHDAIMMLLRASVQMWLHHVLSCSEDGTAAVSCNFCCCPDGWQLSCHFLVTYCCVCMTVHGSGAAGYAAMVCKAYSVRLLMLQGKN